MFRKKMQELNSSAAAMVSSIGVLCVIIACVIQFLYHHDMLNADTKDVWFILSIVCFILSLLCTAAVTYPKKPCEDKERKDGNKTMENDRK